MTDARKIEKSKYHNTQELSKEQELVSGLDIWQSNKV